MISFSILLLCNDFVTGLDIGVLPHCSLLLVLIFESCVCLLLPGLALDPVFDGLCLHVFAALGFLI